MRGVFQRGAFTAEAASASAAVLTAYGFGLVAIVLLRSAVASFQAQGDTKTPMSDRARRRCGQCRLQNRAVQAFWRAWACRCDGRRSLDQSHHPRLSGNPAGRDEDRPVLVENGHGGDVGFLRFWRFSRSLPPRPFQRLTAGLGRFANVMDLMLLGVVRRAVYALILFAGLQLAGVRLRRLRS